MILLLIVALLGGLITFAIVSPLGIATSLLLSPFGGSILAAIAAFILAFRRNKTEHTVNGSFASFLTSDREAA